MEPFDFVQVGGDMNGRVKHANLDSEVAGATSERRSVQTDALAGRQRDHNRNTSGVRYGQDGGQVNAVECTAEGIHL